MDSIRRARAEFFGANGFGADGGYDELWSEAQFGPFPYRVPNPAARGNALRVHDLHHVATGYTADWRGEAEISGWELGSGLGPLSYAWITILFGVFTGLVAHPGPTFRAFVRGRRSRNLFAFPFDAAWLDMSVASLREYLGLPDRHAPSRAGLSDIAAFIASALPSMLFGLSSLPFIALLVVSASVRRLSRGECPLGMTSTV